MNRFEVLEFYTDSNPECELVKELLEENDLISSTRIDALDDSNLKLVDKYNVCMVPTVVVLKNNISLHGLEEIKEFTLLLQQK